jgi:DNA-binding NarL/FixJ family response regulator
LTQEVSILLVEDHLALRKGLELLLRDEGFRVVGVAATVDEGYRMAAARRPDVAVVDVGLEDGSGMDLTEHILSDRPDAGVLVYTGLADQDSVERAANCGARGFVLKTSGPRELTGAIRTVASGGVYVDPTVAATLAPRVGRTALLTAREREILDLLAEGLTGEEAAKHLFLSPETVRTHVRNGMRKLHAKTRAHAIALALREREISL